MYIPYLAKEYGVSIEVLYRWLIREYPQSVIKDNLLSTEPPNELWYYEVCDTKYVRGEVLRHDLLNTFCKQNQKEDQHISVFAKDRGWYNQTAATGSVKKEPNSKVKCFSIWIEMDRKYEGGYDAALKDATAWYENFDYPFSARLWSSGNQSIHIEVDGALFGYPQGYASKLCGRDGWIYRLVRRLTGNLRHPQLQLTDPWTDPEEKVKEAYAKLRRGKPKQGYKQELESFDPNIYSYNSLIRAPWSIHEKGKGVKRIVAGPDEFVPIKPYLGYLYIEELIKPSTKKKVVDIDVDSSYIIQEFSDIPGFDPDDADSNGWVGKLYNPFYNDSNPGLSVNIETGQFWDFGDPDYQFGFTQYLAMKYNITITQAKEMIHDN